MDSVVRNVADGVCSRVFLALALLPTFLVLLLPEGWFDVLGWLAKDIVILGVAGYAACRIPYTDLASKLTLTAFAVWRGFVLLINVAVDVGLYTGDAHYACVAVLALLSASLYVAIYRANSLYDLKSVEPDNRNAYYILIPVHDWWGLLQALILPWHMGRYQSRAVCQGKECWYVSRRRYAKRSGERVSQIHRNHDELGAVFIPLGRPLTAKEQVTLNKLTGKRVIMGISDCRKLMVAGRPEGYIRN